MILSLLLTVFVAHSPAFADERINNRFINGHNVSATSDVLAPGKCAVGPDVIACGVIPGFSLGMSPWMYFNYNMASAAIRGILHEEENGDRWAFQADYFQTYKKRALDSNGQVATTYQMQAAWLLLVRTLRLSDTYRLHINAHTNYYFDEKMPFSIRRPYINRSPWQFNLTTLHEMDLVNGWFILGELGLLDIMNRPMHIHSGVSMGKIWGPLSFHVGFTATGTPRALFSPLSRSDYQQYLRYSVKDGYDSRLDPERVAYDFSLHPEFSLQFMF